jgi:excinuclease ABC subunit B
LPEVSLIGILDADKEGYLRSETSLIQTVGRAARHIDGHVIMFADVETNSMRRAIGETNRRRALQVAYNEAHGITPVGISKGIRDLGDRVRAVAEKQAAYEVKADLPRDEVVRLLKELESQMKAAARQLEFERAAELRDQITQLRRGLAS